jgi:hypothetical protein
MSKTTNITTLRKNRIENETFFNLENKTFIKTFVFIQSLKKSLISKQIDVDDVICTSHNNILSLNINTFFRTKKSVNYKSKLIGIESFKKKLYSNKINNKISGYFSLIKNNLIKFKIKLLNKSINTILIKTVYIKFKKFLNIIFARRFNLFVDFLKLSTLFLEYKISTNLYLYYLGLIFRFLSKKKHTQFIVFLKYLFTFLINSNKEIKGVKFILSGRFQSKMRSSSTKLIVGSVPLQSIGLNIKYNKLHVHTLYGVFGLKLWINN